MPGAGQISLASAPMAPQTSLIAQAVTITFTLIHTDCRDYMMNAVSSSDCGLTEGSARVWFYSLYLLCLASA